MSDFKNAVHTKRRKQDYTLANIGNMDETLVRFDMAQKSTNTIKGENNVRIATTGGAKKGFTVALTALANGTKLPACVIFKEGRLARIPPKSNGSIANTKHCSSVCYSKRLDDWGRYGKWAI